MIITPYRAHRSDYLLIEITFSFFSNVLKYFILLNQPSKRLNLFMRIVNNLSSLEPTKYNISTDLPHFFHAYYLFA